MDPRIALALEHMNRINESKREWASFECANFGYDSFVILRIGIINSRGEKESRDTTRYYFTWNGKANFRKEIHP